MSDVQTHDVHCIEGKMSQMTDICCSCNYMRVRCMGDDTKPAGYKSWQREKKAKKQEEKREGGVRGEKVRRAYP